MLQKEIAPNSQESWKEWLLWVSQRAGEKANNVTNGMLRQHHNQPIELWSAPVIEQKLNDIHQNPVKAGYVEEAVHWRYSRAVEDYAGGKGLVKITLL